MRSSKIAALVMATGLLAAPVLAQGKPAAPAKENGKKARSSNEEVMKNYYKKWVEEDVAYLIAPEEKAVFDKLTTDSERDAFIEQFWARRDPDPKTPYNEFKEEYYRRISYANENFTAGIPGWKTDRGMVYIKYGPPDHIEDYVYGSGYDRPTWEGGGKTKVFPTQFWEYRHIDGIGDDIEIEFVDPEGGNLYRIQTDMNKKDILLHASATSGQTDAEMQGKAKQIDRIVNRYESGVMAGNKYGQREKDRPFAKYELLANMNKAPEIKFKDLKSIVTSRVKYDLFPFDVRTDFIKISEQQYLVPVTLRVRNSDVSFKEEAFGFSRGTLNFYGMVTSMSGKFVKEFEDDIVREYRTADGDKNKDSYATYQKFLMLGSGVYKLGLVVKDLNTGRIGALDVKIQVPSMVKEQISSSSLILSKQVSRVEDVKNDIGPFVLGDLKIIPELDKRFRREESLWVYLQIYNMGIDQTKLEPSVTVDYLVEKDGKEYFRYSDPKGETCQFVSGDRLVIHGKLPIKRFEPGKYVIKVKVSDRVANTSLVREDRFEIIS